MAAEKVTPEHINFMAKHGRGLICLSLTPERCEELDLYPMAHRNTDPRGTYFCVSIDAHPKHGISTGISAHDRAGHTEASVDLARLAGLYPAGVLCEIMKEDGTMARLPDLVEFARAHGLKIITIADLIRYRLRKERLVERTASAHLPTPWGVFRIHAYRHKLTGEEQVALTLGEWKEEEPVLVRVHSECLTGDVFRSMRCDCRPQLESALETIAVEGKGVLVYILGHEGRGIVEANEKLGYPPDLRDYGVGVQILLDLGVRKMKLMTNNPRKIVALEGFGLEIVERVPLKVKPNPYNRFYLTAKKDKLGHLI